MDSEFLEGKLKGWKQVELDTIKTGDHLRITKNKFQEPGRRCSYVVVQSVDEDGEIFVNSYGTNKFPNWRLKPFCQYKQIKIYKRSESTNQHNGKCIRCKVAEVNLPYWICVHCKNNRIAK